MLKEAIGLTWSSESVGLGTTESQFFPIVLNYHLHLGQVLALMGERLKPFRLLITCQPLEGEMSRILFQIPHIYYVLDFELTFGHILFKMLLLLTIFGGRCDLQFIKLGSREFQIEITLNTIRLKPEVLPVPTHYFTNTIFKYNIFYNSHLS